MIYLFILGIIPARGGSKGIPRKNLYPLNGKPLINWTFEAAESSELDSVRITTDDEEIIKVYGLILCFERPPELCQDDTPMIPVVQHAVVKCEEQRGKYVDAVMLLQPTSPLRTTEDINKAIRLFKDSNADSLYSGYYMGIKHKSRVYDKHKEPPHFQRNGAIFITSRELIDKGQLWSDNVVEFEMPKSRSIDIDDLDDMFMAETILKHREAVR